MSTLYKVTLKTKQMISVFKGEGKKQVVEREERFLEQIYGGLPHSTALAYLEKCPDAVIEIDLSFTGQDSRQRTRVAEPSERKAKPKAIRKAAPSPAPADPTLGGGDYSDLVNKLVEKAA